MFFGIGAYFMALITLGRLPLLGDSQWLGLIVAVAAPGLAANLVGRLLFHGKGLSGAYFAMRYRPATLPTQPCRFIACCSHSLPGCPTVTQSI